ncbi:MAG: hypothetical protein V1817_00100 [Candidatus Micrarchaeota archaeon]
MGWLPLSGWSEDTTVIFFFVLVSLFVFTGTSSGYSDSPLVWGFAMFIGVVFALKAVLLGAGLGILLPLLLVFMLFYFQGLGKLLGDGAVAWILCAFIIMVLASAGMA